MGVMVLDFHQLDAFAFRPGPTEPAGAVVGMQVHREQFRHVSEQSEVKVEGLLAVGGRAGILEVAEVL